MSTASANPRCPQIDMGFPCQWRLYGAPPGFWRLLEVWFSRICDCTGLLAGLLESLLESSWKPDSRGICDCTGLLGGLLASLLASLLEAWFSRDLRLYGGWSLPGISRKLPGKNA